MIAHGYFGKVPHCGDFVFRGLPVQVADGLADLASGWVVACRDAGRADWEEACQHAPVWRFALGGGLLGQSGWIGLIAASSDSLGRVFPFAVMAASSIEPSDRQPLSMLDRVLAPVEDVMLAFVGGDSGSDELLAAADSAGHAALDRPAVGPWPDREGRVFAPREEYEAICVSRQRGGPEGFAATFAWPRVRGCDERRPLCLWWHHGRAERCGDFCVSRGSPPVESAAPFFLGDWSRYGWSLCTPADSGWCALATPGRQHE